MPIIGFGGNTFTGPTPVPNSYGLFPALQRIITPEDPHWQAGFQVEAPYCDDLNSTLADCPDIVIPVKEAHRGIDYCDTDPFTVYSSFQCPPVGLTNGRRAFEIAQARYDNNYERKVEQIFWTGVTDAGAIEPALASGNSSCGITVVDLSADAPCVLNPVAAVAVLESAIAGCWPGQGVIHASYGVVPFLTEKHLLREDAGKLFTFSGTRVAAGAGYPGTGPANVAAAPGTTWMFATGQVVAWRSDQFTVPENLAEAVDRSLNNVTVRVETTWGLSFACCLFAVLVNISSDSCG